jgi:hypothetical protein
VIHQIRMLSMRRKIAAAAMAVALITTGIGAWAQISDNMVQTNQFAVLTIDLQGANDAGTPTFTQAVTTNWQLEGTQGVRRILHLKNASNGAVQVTMSASGTGASSITAAIFRIYLAPTVADCGATNTSSPTGNAVLLNPGGSQTVGVASYGGSGINLAAGATAIICETVSPTSAPAAADVATQTVTWTATGNL